MSLPNINVSGLNAGPNSSLTPQFTASFAPTFNGPFIPATFDTPGIQAAIVAAGVAGRTSITVNAGAAVDLEGVQSTTGPAYTWDIIGGTSACVAGVISAPS